MSRDEIQKLRREIKALEAALQEQIAPLNARIAELESQETAAFEEESGLKIGEFRLLSKDLEAELAKRNWWHTTRYHYKVFKVHALNSEGVYIEEADGGFRGTTYVQGYDLVAGCYMTKQPHVAE